MRRRVYYDNWGGRRVETKAEAIARRCHSVMLDVIFYGSLILGTMFVTTLIRLSI